jgi:hypothetical protein
MRSGIWVGAFFGAIIALLLTQLRGNAAEPTSKSASSAKAQNVQLVTFPGTEWSVVKIVRGGASATDKDPQKPAAEKAEIAEIVTFGDAANTSVRVLRGETDRTTALPARPRRAYSTNMEMVSFTAPRDRAVSVFRGSVPPMPDTGLFGAASVTDLDRIAFAVDGAESSHGADPGMWRPEPSGPQGPMQVTAAAATDVGGGDRFDIAANRALGRAYLALMYRRYGNWPDAIAAYNWGPGNVDSWIGGGRAADKFPLEVERYRERVLRDAAVGERGTLVSSSSWPFAATASRVSANK